MGGGRARLRRPKNRERSCLTTPAQSVMLSPDAPAHLLDRLQHERTAELIDQSHEIGQRFGQPLGQPGASRTGHVVDGVDVSRGCLLYTSRCV